MVAPEMDSAEGIRIGDVLIHAGNVDGLDCSGVEAGADVTGTANVLAAGSLNVLSAWTDVLSSGAFDIGTLPANSYVIETFIQVTEAYNGASPNTFAIGYAADTNAYAEGTNVETTGIKTSSPGVLMGYNATSRLVQGLRTIGAFMTAGKVLCGVLYFSVSSQP
jgi:hypothetical protein